MLLIKFSHRAPGRSNTGRRYLPVAAPQHPAGFARATKFVRRKDVADSIPCGRAERDHHLSDPQWRLGRRRRQPWFGNTHRAAALRQGHGLQPQHVVQTLLGKPNQVIH
jgi:hypothetical protein